MTRVSFCQQEIQKSFLSSVLNLLMICRFTLKHMRNHFRTVFEGSFDKIKRIRYYSFVE